MIDEPDYGWSGDRHQEFVWPDEQPRGFLSSETRQVVRQRARVERAWRRHGILVTLVVLACLVIAAMVALLVLRRYDLFDPLAALLGWLA